MKDRRRESSDDRARREALEDIAARTKRAGLERAAKAGDRAAARRLIAMVKAKRRKGGQE